MASFAERLQTGSARDESVFINCPFDGDFAHARAAIVFAVVCCGLIPRSAEDSGRVDEPRIERILAALGKSRYSIHDLSRCQGEGDINLARFNMPLELGMAMVHSHTAAHAAHAAPTEDRLEHQWLVLAPEKRRFEIFISDLAGFDPKRHDESPEMIAKRALSWLVTLAAATPGVELESVMGVLGAFLFAWDQLELEWAGEPPWSYVFDLALSHVPL